MFGFMSVLASGGGGGGPIGFLKHELQMGGWPLIPIAILAVVSAIIVIERAIVLYLLSAENKDGILRGLQSHILRGDIPAAIRFIEAQKSGPLSRIIKAGLVRLNKSDKEVQAALDEASLREVPYLEKRTGYLAVFSNATTLVGLLGTIIGMIHCFAAVANVDPSQKATILAAGIAEAMTCTKWGLGVAIVLLIIYAFLQARTQQLIDRINETVVGVLNLAMANKQALKNVTIPEESARAR
jgi:biopolymer transport protein ExbB/TolQ